MGCKNIYPWLKYHSISVLMIIFYISEYITMYLRSKYWEGSLASSFDQNPTFRWAAISQAIINGLLCCVLLCWVSCRMLSCRILYTNLPRPSSFICWALIITLGILEILTLKKMEKSSSSKWPFIIQLLIDVFASILTSSYFIFDRSSQQYDTGDEKKHRAVMHWFIFLSCILQLCLLFLALAINVLHEIKTTIDLFHAATIVQNILLFEIFYLGFDLVVEIGAHRVCLPGSRNK